MMRCPLVLYKLGLGTLLGKRFLKLTHTGRISGLLHDTVLEVVTIDDDTGKYYIASGWGEKSNWYKNILVNHRVRVQVGSLYFDADTRKLPPGEAGEIIFDYAVTHRGAFKMLTERIVGETLEPTHDNARKMSEYVPVFSLTPTPDNR